MALIGDAAIDDGILRYGERLPGMVLMTGRCECLYDAVSKQLIHAASTHACCSVRYEYCWCRCDRDGRARRGELTSRNAARMSGISSRTLNKSTASMDASSSGRRSIGACTNVALADGCFTFVASKAAFATSRDLCAWSTATTLQSGTTATSVATDSHYTFSLGVLGHVVPCELTVCSSPSGHNSIKTD